MTEAWYIQQSKHRCSELGIDPTVIPQFSSKLTEEELMLQQSAYAEILSVVRHFVGKFLVSMKETPLVITVSDEDGYLLEVIGDETMQQALQQLGLQVGVQFQEKDCGTNAVNLALVHGIPISLVGLDHYHHFLQRTACYCAPLHSFDSPKVLGTVGMMTSIESAHPMLLTLLTTVVDSIERELQLLKQNRKLDLFNQMMMDTTRSGIIQADIEGQIVQFNLFAEQLTGMKQETAYMLSAFELEPLGRYFWNVLKNQKKYESIELTFKTKDGKERICLVDLLPVHDKHHAPTSAICHFRDITEFKRAEEMLRHSEKLSVVGQLAAGVVHEIRNPLTTLRGFVQFFQSDIKEPYAELMLSELDRINTMVSEFLLIAKPQSALFQQKDLGQILTQTYELFQTQANMHNTIMHLSMEDAPIRIECDENQLKQVLINILKNSIEAMPSGGNIYIRTLRKDPDHVLIEVVDEGDGMSPDIMERIGEPFYTTKSTGTGLGLMVTKRIIENHRGKFSIQSQVGKGTKVELVLPVSEG
ncbi:ATP-binding protein [Ammoniphilus sp. 3BR4]|uniref:ATP-binding protein n=1 Tax=Ammoniphilus sp. 3BR4 TaxID=3158265 RepID=UPI003464EE60